MKTAAAPHSLAVRRTGSCLFSAPSEFLGTMVQEYQAILPTTFREIWRKEELVGDGHLTAWVVNPGQQFIVDQDVLQLFPSLSALITPSTGANHIDRSACARRGVAVYSLLDERPMLDRIAASAEFTVLLLLNTLRRLDVAVGEVSAGRWRSHESLLRGHELQGRQVGLVGLGRIGRRVARVCEAFGARIAYHDPDVSAPEYPAWTLEELFTRADVVCVCCALTPHTTGMITGTLLRRLKAGACFVNTSRGEVLVERELAEVLAERPDLRVGLDVLAAEATGRQHQSPLLAFHRRSQIVITPHMAGATVESQTAAARIALELLRRHVEHSTESRRCDGTP